MELDNTSVDKVAQAIENLIKKEIKRKGLIKSGKMLKSIEVKANISNNQFSFSVEAEDYFVEVDENNNILKDMQKTKEFNKIVGDIEELIFQSLQDNITKAIKNIK